MINQSIDPDALKIAELEGEYDELDLPQCSIVDILLTLGDAFDIDPRDVLIYDDAHDEDMRDTHGTLEYNTMRDMLDLALESTTQLPHIADALRIRAELTALDYEG